MVVRIYVGSDVYQQKAGAEEVLEYSIRKHASMPVEIHWMRAGDNFKVSNGRVSGHWNLCREPGQAWPKHGHGTDFSVFRMAVPELCGFSGKAIYLDADMLVLGDIAELWNLPQRAPYLCNGKGRTEVALLDCAAFGKLTWWPRLRAMQESGTYLHEYRLMLQRNGFLDESLSWDWNACDRMTGTAKLIHFTSVPHQPYRPYPGVQYREHPDSECVRLWHQYREELHASGRRVEST